MDGPLGMMSTTALESRVGGIVPNKHLLDEIRGIPGGPFGRPHDGGASQTVSDSSPYQCRQMLSVP